MSKTIKTIAILLVIVPFVAMGIHSAWSSYSRTSSRLAGAEESFRGRRDKIAAQIQREVGLSETLSERARACLDDSNAVAETKSASEAVKASASLDSKVMALQELESKLDGLASQLNEKCLDQIRVDYSNWRPFPRRPAGYDDQVNLVGLIKNIEGSSDQVRESIEHYNLDVFGYNSYTGGFPESIWALIDGHRKGAELPCKGAEACPGTWNPIAVSRPGFEALDANMKPKTTSRGKN
jgi:hypothetical protein